MCRYILPKSQLIYQKSVLIIKTISIFAWKWNEYSLFRKDKRNKGSMIYILRNHNHPNFKSPQNTSCKKRPHSLSSDMVKIQ